MKNEWLINEEYKGTTRCGSSGNAGMSSVHFIFIFDLNLCAIESTFKHLDSLLGLREQSKFSWANNKRKWKCIENDTLNHVWILLCVTLWWFPCKQFRPGRHRCSNNFGVWWMNKSRYPLTLRVLLRMSGLGNLNSNSRTNMRTIEVDARSKDTEINSVICFRHI